MIKFLKAAPVVFLIGTIVTGILSEKHNKNLIIR